VNGELGWDWCPRFINGTGLFPSIARCVMSHEEAHVRHLNGVAAAVQYCCQHPNAELPMDDSWGVHAESECIAFRDTLLCLAARQAELNCPPIAISPECQIINAQIRKIKAYMDELNCNEY
jgi:hypothetical protein